MHKRLWSSSLRWLKCLLLIGGAVLACAAIAQPDPVASLRAKYAALDQQLRQNQFQRPLVVDSSETPNRLKGDIYAIIDYPFDVVSVGLNSPDHWCDVMLLHINTKYCRAVARPSGTRLRVHIGRKTPELLAAVPSVDLSYSVAAATPQYLEILLNAADGPLGTSDYRLQLEALALPGAKTFLHLMYSYSMNMGARLAMQTYLGTIGRAKVGFTVIGKLADGQPDYIGGMRGLVERNTMRYYLAIDSFLAATSSPPQVQLEQRLQSWFSATERYPRQLHELDRAAYLEMKRAENLRQQTVQ